MSLADPQKKGGTSTYCPKKIKVDVRRLRLPPPPPYPPPDTLICAMCGREVRGWRGYQGKDFEVVDGSQHSC